MFHCHLSYGLLLWGNAANVRQDNIRGKSWETCKSTFSSLNILTTYSLYVYLNLIYANEHIYNLALRLNVHRFNARYKNNLDTPQCRLFKSLNHFHVKILQLFNKLPINIRNLNLNRFKSVLSTF
ncbi:hypothetical protein J437_LFUL010716 [Ladona fulva]|uniref:Uncharacterized protein n=1 Tax=Ladona fulva TaxID=123851 RepID=A0A8K0K502_LADFU|nr:hypothetical protein J437_LFUL010716 [Ladona fulva]